MGVATAYGSWNDFIKDGVAEPTDDQIIKDLYTHWHISKRDVPKTDSRWALQDLNLSIPAVAVQTVWLFCGPAAS